MTRILFSAAIVLAAISISVPAGALPRAGHSGFAVVQDDGTLVRGSNATAATHQGTGTYEVDFASSVKKCVFTATLGLPGSEGTEVPGFVTVAGRSGTDDGVYVTTYDKRGDPTDLGFHLNVRC